MVELGGVSTSLTAEEVEEVRRRLGREPTPVEAGMIDIMWSEHCSYKSSKRVLRILPRRGPRVLVGPGYDAGVVDIGDGWAIAFKIESHNHPSAIEPYNGAATGIGGIVRDILAVGARPIALLDPLRFGDPRKSDHAKWLLNYVVKGIADYGNCIGVPTVGGDIEFDESFETNCLVNVACIGIVRKDRIVKGEMRHPGDILILIGGSTGRDGIHGVTFASRPISERSEEDRPAVQIGDPFMEKLLIEAVLEVLSTGYVHGIKDLGGGGLTCCSSEMASKGGVGVDLFLENVHIREAGMHPYEYMLSESQERMMLVVDPKGVPTVLGILRKYGIPYSVVGRVTSSGRLRVFLLGQLVADLPPTILTEVYEPPRRAKRPAYLDEIRRKPKPPPYPDLEDAFLKLLASPNICSRAWVYRQYDHEVGDRTVVKPGDGDAAVLRLFEVPNKAIAITADCNSKHSFLDPFHGTAGAVAEAARNVTAVGAVPLAVTDGVNMGNPEKPEHYWQFKRAIYGLNYALRSLEIPCVGGNVSFYNEDERTGRAVKPTVFVVMLGLIEDLSYVRTMAFKQPGNYIVVVGRTYAECGGSEYFEEVLGFVGGRVPKFVPERERRSLLVVQEIIRADRCVAVHDVSKGGLAIAIAEMAIKGGFGVDADVARAPRARIRIDELLFSETHSRFVLECRPDDVKAAIAIAQLRGVPVRVIGRVTTEKCFVLRFGKRQLVNRDLVEISDLWERALPRIMHERYPP
ncbi:phosphoribosylformylglycinamidine synthase subunit PurL [archaeon]|nr:phosphoribosylformylglycinamidine synthase subunit PurL [archaeon]